VPALSKRVNKIKKGICQMANGNNETFISWKWLVGILISIVILIAGFVVSDTRCAIDDANKEIKKLEDKKLDKEIYYRDIRDIKDNLDYLVKRELRK
jgi:uncharacterized protein YpmS